MRALFSVRASCKLAWSVQQSWTAQLLVPAHEMDMLH